MHVDQMLAEWTTPLWAQLEIDGITALIVLIALYFTVKWAVKSGIKEAVREMKAKTEDEKMNEFVMAALPWIWIGIAIALFAENHGAKKKAKENGKEYDNYMTEGMCLGMCVGTALGGNGLSLGMLIGMVIGMCIQKEK